MNISIKASKYKLAPDTEALIEKKLSAPFKLLGAAGDTALLEIEVEEAPPEGRSSTPCRLVARISVEGKVYRAEAVKPNPESAADRVRSELEAEIRRDRGRAHKLWKRGGAAMKRMLRLG